MGAKAIIRGGFKLPRANLFRKSGWFGNGIYFTDTPLKAWQYTVASRSCYILVCDVALGREKKLLRKSRESNLQTLRKPLERASSAAFAHDSVVGMGEDEGGSKLL